MTVVLKRMPVYKLVDEQQKQEYHQRIRNRRLWAGCLLVFLYLAGIWLVKETYEQGGFPKDSEPEKEFLSDKDECYELARTSQSTVDLLQDVMDSAKKPKMWSSVFFLDTSCAKDGLISLTPRQACSLESVARQNSERDVYALFASPVGYDKNEINLPSVIEALRSYPNIFLRNVNLTTMAASTAAEKWLSTGELFTSSYLTKHVSDLLRLLVLYRFGGYVMDFDFMCLKSLDEIKTNFFGGEDSSTVGNRIMGFSHDGIGHFVLDSYLRKFTENFNGDSKDANGPMLLTQLANEICKTENVEYMTGEKCKAFNVYQREEFFPIRAKDWYRYYAPKYANDTLKKLVGSTAIYTWFSRFEHSNRHDFNLADKLEPNAAYSILAKTSCPKVYESTTEIF